MTAKEVLNMKKPLSLFLSVFLLLPFAAGVQLKAITPPHFGITSNDYSVGSSKVDRPEKQKIETGESLQLYGIAKIGNDIWDVGEEDNHGWFVTETLSEGITWSSDDPGVASVDKNGMVIGVKEGKTVIRAEYDGNKVHPDVNKNEYKIEVLPGVPFKDVPGDMWFYSNVKFVYEKNLMVGTDKNVFEPDAELTRAMAVTVLYRMETKLYFFDLMPPLGIFDDVPAGSWYEESVGWAKTAGVSVGKTDTLFDPESYVTRAEFATMLYRYFKSMGGNSEIRNAGTYSTPADLDLVPDWAREAVAALSSAGIIKGRPGNRFDPYAEITRAEAAALYGRFFYGVTRDFGLEQMPMAD